MPKLCLGWRRVLLCTFAAAVCSLALGGVARASQDLSYTNVFSPDDDVHWWNQNPAYWNKLITYQGYQFMIYWDADYTLVVERRRLSDNDQQTYHFGSSAVLGRPLDPHNDTAMGISPDGRLHLTYGQHQSTHHYRMSNAGCATQTTFTDCTFSAEAHQTDDTAEDNLTYPVYFNDAEGNLYFAYRYNNNSNGSEYMNKYDNDGTWTEIGRMLKGTSGSGSYDDGTGNGTSTTRGPYVDGFVFDKSDRLP